MLTIPQHRTKLFEILEVISNSVYGKDLGFKGGTLSYFLYKLDRFSTDLDFDILGPVNEEKMLVDIWKTLSNIGIIKDHYNKKWTIFWLLDYSPGEMNIKIEINKRIWTNDVFELKKILGTELFCMDKSSMFANKLVALMERQRTVSRDLYDINFFFRQWFPINTKLIEERTGQSVNVYLEEVKQFILKYFNTKNLLAWLGEVIDNKQKNFVKEKLIENTVGYIDLYLR